jgi:hypothetical protein
LRSANEPIPEIFYQNGVHGALRNMPKPHVSRRIGKNREGVVRQPVSLIYPPSAINRIILVMT